MLTLVKVCQSILDGCNLGVATPFYKIARFIRYGVMTKHRNFRFGEFYTHFSFIASFIFQLKEVYQLNGFAVVKAENFFNKCGQICMILIGEAQELQAKTLV